MQHSGKQFLTTQVENDSRLATKQALVLEGLRQYGHVRLRVFGTSMLPALWPGDVLCVERTDAGEIGVGEIVLFERREHLFAHRVIAAWGTGERRVLVTRGDSLAHQDPPVDSSQLQGRVTRVIRAEIETRPERHPGLFSTAASWLLCRSGALKRVAVAWHSRCRFPKKGSS